MGYRLWLPISEVISEGNVGLMQAVKRFEPEKGFRSHLCHVVDQGGDPGIHPALVSLVKMAPREPEEALLQLRKAKSRISGSRTATAPDQVTHRQAARRHRAGRGRDERASAASVAQRADPRGWDSGEWQDWLADEGLDQESVLADSEEPTTAARRWARRSRLLNDRERRIFEARRLADDPITLEDLAAEFGVSRERVRQIEVRASRRCRRR